MTSPRPSSSVCSEWRLPDSVPEISAASHRGPHPPPFADGRLWAVGAVLSEWVASVAWLVKPVLGCWSAEADVARFGDVLGVYGGGSENDDVGGSAGDGIEDAGGVPGAGAGAGRGDGLAVPGADAGESACDGVASGPAGSPSSPSCGPWCSCSHWTWRQGDESARPSTSFWFLSALAGLGEKHRGC